MSTADVRTRPPLTFEHVGEGGLEIGAADPELAGVDDARAWRSREGGPPVDATGPFQLLARRVRVSPKKLNDDSSGKRVRGPGVGDG